MSHQSANERHHADAVQSTAASGADAAHASIPGHETSYDHAADADAVAITVDAATEWVTASGVCRTADDPAADADGVDATDADADAFRHADSSPAYVHGAHWDGDVKRASDPRHGPARALPGGAAADGPKHGRQPVFVSDGRGPCRAAAAGVFNATLRTSGQSRHIASAWCHEAMFFPQPAHGHVCVSRGLISM